VGEGGSFFQEASLFPHKRTIQSTKAKRRSAEKTSDRAAAQARHGSGGTNAPGRITNEPYRRQHPFDRDPDDNVISDVRFMKKK